MAMSVIYTTVAGRIVSENRGGVERFYGQDPLGSVVALLDSTQSETDSVSYWPYGEELASSGTSQSPFRYVGSLGYHSDLRSRRTYVRARTYAPPTGRWLSRDPLWPDESAYGYVDGSGTTLSDPSGMGYCYVVDVKTTSNCTVFNKNGDDIGEKEIKKKKAYTTCSDCVPGSVKFQCGATFTRTGLMYGVYPQMRTTFTKSELECRCYGIMDLLCGIVSTVINNTVSTIIGQLNSEVTTDPSQKAWVGKFVKCNLSVTAEVTFFTCAKNPVKFTL
jgi:RHS repeat-associated protein